MGEYKKCLKPPPRLGISWARKKTSDPTHWDWLLKTTYWSEKPWQQPWSCHLSSPLSHWPHKISHGTWKWWFPKRNFLFQGLLLRFHIKNFGAVISICLKHLWKKTHTQKKKSNPKTSKHLLRRYTSEKKRSPIWNSNLGVPNSHTTHLMSPPPGHSWTWAPFFPMRRPAKSPGTTTWSKLLPATSINRRKILGLVARMEEHKDIKLTCLLKKHTTGI